MCSMNALALKYHPDPELVKKIHSLQQNNAGLYARDSLVPPAKLATLPALIRDIMGTGLGKTFTRILQHINDHQTTFGCWRNMIFVTPQKVQIDFPAPLVTAANKKNIRILCLLSRDDLGNLDFRKWVFNESDSKLSNREIYSSWVERAKVAHTEVKAILYVLGNTVKAADTFCRMMMSKGLDAKTKEHYKIQMQSERVKIPSLLESLCRSILKHITDFDELSDLFQSDRPRGQLYTQIFEHVMPLASALCVPCILLATSRKFDLKIGCPFASRDGRHLSSKYVTFDSLLGGKKEPKFLTLSETNGINENDKINLIREKLLEPDPQNPFVIRGIATDVVIDEEHDSFEIFNQSLYTNLINKNHNLAHALASLHSIFRQVSEVSEPEKHITCLFREKAWLVDDVRDSVSRFIDMPHGMTVEDVLEVFSDNIDQIVINSADTDKVLAISSNIFKLGRSCYMNADGLKNLRLKRICGERTCLLYFTEDAQDNNPSLFIFYQVVMAVLYAAGHLHENVGGKINRDAGGRNNLVNFLKSDINGANRNEPLAVLIEHAVDIASEMEGMFHHVNDGAAIIDYFFVYICTKIILAIEPVKKLNFVSGTDEDLVQVNFSMTFSRGTPETMLLRILEGTNNTVTLMSATTGFRSHYINKFSWDFFVRYAIPLDIHLLERNNDDNVADIRMARGGIRNIKVACFNDKNNRLMVRKETEFVKAFADLMGVVNSRCSDQNPYRRQEISNQIEAILHTAWDKKNTLTLGINGLFMRLLSGWVRELDELGISVPELPDLQVLPDSNGSVFEFKPFPAGATVRVILFTADIGKRSQLNDWMTLNDSNMRLVVCGYRKAAGTGINLFPKLRHNLGSSGIDQPMEVDFDRLILVNGPFWSPVIQDGSDQRGMQNMQNIQLLLRFYAHKKPRTPLSEFDFNTLSYDDIQQLWHQHYAHLFITSIQNCGRTERKNCQIAAEIWMPQSLFRDISIEFNRLVMTKGNEHVLNMLSFNNDYIFQMSRKWISKVSFCDSEKGSAEDIRRRFETTTGEMNRNTKRFFDETFVEVLMAARSGDRDAIEFNKRLRSIDCLKDINNYIYKLITCDFVMKYPELKEALESFYLFRNSELEVAYGPMDDDGICCLTDLYSSDQPYEPEKWMVPTDLLKPDSNMEPFVRSIARKLQMLVKDAFINYLPMPEFICLIKGNLGEHVVELLLREKRVAAMRCEDLISMMGFECYELFDFFVSQGDTLLCIDAKHWSLHIGAPLDRKKKIWTDLERKRRLVWGLLERTPYRQCQFLYLNSRIADNHRHLKCRSDEHGTSHFLNIFQRNDRYLNNGDGTSRLISPVSLNPELVKILDQFRLLE